MKPHAQHRLGARNLPKALVNKLGYAKVAELTAVPDSRVMTWRSKEYIPVSVRFPNGLKKKGNIHDIFRKRR